MTNKLKEIKSYLDEVKKYIEEIENEPQEQEWVEINNQNCPTLAKYGCKPFRIMKKKVRKLNSNEVWNNINFYDAQEEVKKLGYRLPDIREILALMEHYRKTQKKVSYEDKEFLGIEELSYGEYVNLEWINASGVAFRRGGHWISTSYAGAFAAGLVSTPGGASSDIGFRCACDPVEIPKSKTLKKIKK